MKLTEEQAQDILCGDSDEFTVLDEGEWIGGGKYEHRDVVFRAADDDTPVEDGVKGFMMSVSRTGSHYTDWYYDYQLECPEVVRIPCVSYTWEKAK
jgi:hypothetical protein